MHVIQIMGAASGEPTGHDGEYVVAYTPPAMDASGHYVGGVLRTSADSTAAMQFSDAGAALEFWRQQNGRRPDGKPNRPLTGYTVEIKRVGDSNGA